MPELAAGVGITLAKNASTGVLRIDTDVVSGRLGAATYAELATVTTADEGTVAEVPTSDAGTHTDPVVGGTVNNTGIFRWSASPAGWERIADVDALSGQSYAAAAEASADAAAAQAALVAPKDAVLGTAPAVWDGFNRADGAIGTADSGHVWAVAAGSVSISSNKASGVDGTAVVDLETADHDVTLMLDPVGSSDNGRLITRLIDGTTYLSTILLTTGTVRLIKYVGGVATTLQTLAGVTVNATAKLRTVTSGRNIKVWLDDVLYLNHTMSEDDFAMFGEATKAGFRLRSTTRATRFVARQADPQTDARATSLHRSAQASVARDQRRLTAIANAEHGVATTAIRTTLGVTIASDGLAHFRGAVVAANGDTYCINRHHGAFVIIEPDGTVVESDLGLTPSELADINLSGGTNGPDGLIYAPPRDSDKFCIIDPLTRTAVLTDFGLALTTNLDKWTGIILGLDNLLYCLPSSAGKFAIIDVFSRTAWFETFGLTFTGTLRHAGGSIGATGEIVIPPYNNSAAPTVAVMLVDTLNQRARYEDYGLDLTGLGRWNGGVLGADGRTYCCPRNSPHVLVIDTFKNTAELKDYGLTIPDGGNMWSRFITGSDGKIYGTPASATEVLVIDPIADTAILTDYGLSGMSAEHKWIGGCQMPNGDILCTPDAATDFLVITPAASEPWPIELLMSPLWNKSP